MLQECAEDRRTQQGMTRALEDLQLWACLSTSMLRKILRPAGDNTARAGQPCPLPGAADPPVSARYSSVLTFFV